jgi:hypothetical protein
MKERVISSKQTFMIKFVFPTFWISMFGMGTAGLFFGLFRGPNNSTPEPWMKWYFLAIWITGTVFIWRTCAGLKKVRVEEDIIYVSNYFKEIGVPFNAIREVTENRWINIHPVTIHFRLTTSFGNHITFIPTWQVLSWRPHPIVAELRGLAHL